MTDTKQQVERRKHKRFPVTKDTFVGLQPDYFQVGQTLNISVGGMAFTYMVNGKPPMQSSILNIFSADRTFHLRDVPFRIISDIARDGIPFSALMMRECTVQFEDLTFHQKNELEYFIQNQTKGEEKV
ncbi:MAG: PilZ domain-containing protein [Deltaproteobacteria bacterium]|jgi:hypothetical protein|nr:PilZ domain-containing protein [Deltaproteobacteria bacterium]MBW2565561.1 PilZ domain-containing protein [Deltaproteobacteria bacterium]